MRNNGQKRGGAGIDTQSSVPRPGKGGNGMIPNSFKSFSNYLRIVSSGASSVASTVRSAASSIVERDSEINRDQVLWAGFDKFELERSVTRRVLLLGYVYGFQVWDVELSDSLRILVSRHDGPVSFMQMLPTPISSKQTGDKFADSLPLLVICADGSFSGGDNVQEGSYIPHNGTIQTNESGNGNFSSTVVWFFSLRSQSYVHLLRFRSVVHLVRCSSRVVAVLQSAQVHCFNTTNLEREYTILTNPVVTGCHGSGNIGFGPLAIGPRWMAYSGSQVEISNSGRVSPQQLAPSASFPSPASNGSLVAHYAKESSKQLAAGIVSLGDIGYKKLSRYYSELLPEYNNKQSGTARAKVPGVSNGLSHDIDNVGMVIVRDIVSKTVIAQFKAHKSHILSLCFDPSGILLVTASTQGHNINVFRIMPRLPGSSCEAEPGSSYVHLYRLQRGLTNAVIQDISFSSNSQWIMITSSRGTSHLFAVSPSGGLVSFQSPDACGAKNSVPQNSGLQVLTQHNVCASGPPVTLSAVSRIRNGNNGWKNSVTGAAAAATGRTSPFSGAITAAFHNCKSNGSYADPTWLKKHYHLLVFSPSGCLIQYALRISPDLNGATSLPAVSTIGESGLCGDSVLVVEAIQKWNVCQKQNHKEREDKINMYGENGNSEGSKIFSGKIKQENAIISPSVNTTTKQSSSSEENHRMHISEAELQMHQLQNPVWARSEVYFQLIRADAIDTNEVSGEGEIEIERIPCCALEAGPKSLVPVYEYIHAPKFKPGRTSSMNHNINGKSQFSENGKVAGRSCNTYNSETSDDYAGNDSINTADGPGHDALRLSTEKTINFVNTNDTPIEDTHDIVNTSDFPLRSVNYRDGLE